MLSGLRVKGGGEGKGQLESYWKSYSMMLRAWAYTVRMENRKRRWNMGRTAKTRQNKLSLLLVACREKKRESNRWGFNNWRQRDWLSHRLTLDFRWHIDWQGTEEKAEAWKRHADVPA